MSRQNPVVRRHGLIGKIGDDPGAIGETGFLQTAIVIEPAKTGQRLRVQTLMQRAKKTIELA